MICYLVFGFVVFSSVSVLCLGPENPPTKGRVWPQPQIENRGDSNIIFVLDDRCKGIQVPKACDILKQSAERHFPDIPVLENGELKLSYQSPKLVTRKQADDYEPILSITVNVENPKCDEYPYLGMDESYNLTVPADSPAPVIDAHTVWGALRGIETLSQLFYPTDDFKANLIQAVNISDYPVYPHRGYLLDTSRHYISVENILLTLDAMEMNKMNVFHWHILDDQSFPYESQVFPELSQKGAYYPTFVYRIEEDIKPIIEYARNRGIRVVPEFDMPGHVNSWGASHPELLTECGGLGPINFVRNETYDFLRMFLEEAQNVFPDKYVHLGGDEVGSDCWNKNKEIQDFVKTHNITNYPDYFTRNVLNLLNPETTTIYWEEVYSSGVQLPKKAVIQQWKGNGDETLSNIVNAGHNALDSNNFYLDFIYRTFTDFYGIKDPRTRVKAQVTDEALLQNILGGEACMWGEMIDDSNFLSRSWPRTSAVAEILWSTDNKPSDAYNRIEEHVCRMRARGVPASPPTGPGYCVVDNHQGISHH